MQQELLLEFLCEEIPAKLQKKVSREAKDIFSNILNKNGVIFENVEFFIASKRMTFKVNRLLYKTKDLFEEKRGPKIGTNEKAIEGFLRSNNKKYEDLKEKDGYYYLELTTSGVEVKTLFNNIIESFLEKMVWPKTMRWYIEEEKCLSVPWIRPIRSILCIYDGSMIDTYIKSIGLKTCDYTYGHRFLSSDLIRIKDFEDYYAKLQKNYIMLSYDDRRNYIEREMVQKAAAIGLCIKDDSDLLDEVAGLVEYPFVHIGTIDEKFMNLPQAVLSTSMRVHQKYFTLTYPDSIIAPFFVTITNVPGTSIMYEGLDRVLRARLSDAAFFYKEDTDVTLEAFTQRLSNVVFHEKLGSMARKIDRMMSISNSKEEHRTVALCKADLLTQMVGEFPELQGIMGEIYAKVQDEDDEVCVGIREHYKPLGASDSLPSTHVGARVSFFDKLDTLVGFLGVGIYPTGSKDPFALRRSALCVVRLLCDFEEDILENETFTWYIETLMNAYSDQGIALDIETITNVKDFIIDRLKVYMEDKLLISIEAIETVFKSINSNDIDYKKLVNQAKKLDTLFERDGFEIIQNAYKRIIGILCDIEVDFIDDLDFKDQNMIALQNSVNQLEQNSFDKFDDIIKMAKNIILACDNVLINDSDKILRTRNLTILKKAQNIIEEKIGILA